MSASIRFLGFAVLAWAGVRAASLGLLPGTQQLTPAASAATTPQSAPQAAVTPPVMPTDQDPGMSTPPMGPAYQPYPQQPMMVPVYYYPVQAPQPRFAAARMPSPRYRPSAWDGVAPTPEPIYFSAEPEPSPPTRMAAAMPAPSAQSAPPTATAVPAPGMQRNRFDRLELSAWALLRGSPGPGNLATGGTLGGSQAGARLTYNFTPSLAATLRSSSSVGGVRYAEVAAGVRWRPMRQIPVAMTFERRQALNRWGGRSAFALFAEGGLYQRPLFDLANLDLYAQAGVVGLKNRDLFMDGGATFTRPVWRKFSAGFGVWGGAQPGLYRLDAGPRVSMEAYRGIRVHADYRQRLIGNAMPASGPALTIAGDF
jgi:hypothetical protein